LGSDAVADRFLGNGDPVSGSFRDVAVIVVDGAVGCVVVGGVVDFSMGDSGERIKFASSAVIS
jgi:hypothetical protein